MRNASLATRGERAATLRRRAVTPLFCTSPLSHPLSFPLRRPSFAFLLLLLLALSFSHSFFSALLFPSTRGLSFAHSSVHLIRPSLHPPFRPHLRVRMYVSRGALFVLSFDLPQSPSSAIPLLLSLSPQRLLFRFLSISCDSSNVPLFLSHTRSQYSPLRFSVDIHPTLLPACRSSLRSFFRLFLSPSLFIFLYLLALKRGSFLLFLLFRVNRGRLLANRAYDNAHACAIDVLIGRLF